MPRFSVIIPVYNRPAYVMEAVQSVLCQTCTDMEIIVVDDASSDGTAEVLRSLGERIKVIRLSSQSGCEVARNVGAKASRGEYLAFLDSDDVYFHHALETYDNVINALSAPPVIVSRLAYFSNTLPDIGRKPDQAAGIEVVVFPDYLARDRSMGSSTSMIVVRKDAFERAGGFRQSTATTFNMSDHDFLLRVGCESPAVLIESPKVVAYRNHQGNSVRGLQRVVEGMLRIVNAERRGDYPGGIRRRFDRKASIGGPAVFWCRRAAQHGFPLFAAKLLVISFDAILAKLLKSGLTRLRGVRPTTRLQPPNDRIASNGIRPIG